MDIEKVKLETQRAIERIEHAGSYIEADIDYQPAVDELTLARESLRQVTRCLNDDKRAPATPGEHELVECRKTDVHNVLKFLFDFFGDVSMVDKLPTAVVPPIRRMEAASGFTHLTETFNEPVMVSPMNCDLLTVAIGTQPGETQGWVFAFTDNKWVSVAKLQEFGVAIVGQALKESKK